MKNKLIRGISPCNPVDLAREYVQFTVDYAIKRNFNHYHFVGPTHHPVRGNVDGIILYRKYAQFNDEKDAEYVNYCKDVINEACKKLSKNGIKSYYWHHELEVPARFLETYPELKHEFGDVEVTHPLIKDFLENKIEDFFYTYPKMDGIILTLHETRIPLLKLQNQKLGKIERVQYVTKILYDTCKRLGKDLIVRPFASIEEDYEMMTKAYEQISRELVVMDKWTQFDWSLTLPENAFFNKIKNNPLLVETDIFGEYFGKGAIPIMLKKHILKNYSYCEKFKPLGYISRMDRDGKTPFGTVNEVNLRIMEACLSGNDVDEAIDTFFEEKYPSVGQEIRALMEGTEDIQTKIFYINNYYFSDQSRFFRLNHSKNHFYFEMMKDEYSIVSNEWFIPKKWERGSLQDVFAEKQEAVSFAEDRLARLTVLKEKLSEKAYFSLYRMFKNLYYAARIWQLSTDIFYAYAKYFEKQEAVFEEKFYEGIEKLSKLDQAGKNEFRNNYYCLAVAQPACVDNNTIANPVGEFISEIKASFAMEKEGSKALRSQNLTDYILCGGACEGHKLQKEVNFSDTYIMEDGLCRIPGTNKGKDFSVVNAHGWFSFELAVKPNKKNEIEIVAKGSNGKLEFNITIDGKQTEIRESAEGKHAVKLSYMAKDNKHIRIRIDRVSANLPYFYEIKVL